jgi:hypothetical protein
MGSRAFRRPHVISSRRDDADRGRIRERASCGPGGTARVRGPTHTAGRSRSVASRRYEFRVAGHLSDHVRGAFPDMTVLDVPPETIIYGQVVDESHMHGVLALIRNLGLHVVSVNQVRE